MWYAAFSINLARVKRRVERLTDWKYRLCYLKVWLILGTVYKVTQVKTTHSFAIFLILKKANFILYTG